MLKEMAKMFSDMGMPMDIEILRNMLSQVRDQFQKMGIDPEKLSNQDMKLILTEIQTNLEKLWNRC